MYTVSEFKQAWKELLVKYDLIDHHFMVKALRKRKKSVKAYNRGTFCARMASTKRSQSANHMLKTIIPRNSSMNRFVANIDTLLERIYSEEERAEHETKQVICLDCRVWAIQRHAMEIYTSRVYEKFCDEISKGQSYDLVRVGDNIHFKVRHTNAEVVERYKKSEFQASVDNGGERYLCECGLYEHFGLLCCHIMWGGFSSTSEYTRCPRLI